MTLQDDENLYSRRRTIYLILGLLFTLFFGRLYQLQLIYQDEYGKKSEENAIRTIPREPVRGYMYDRTGKLVVDNRPAFTVTIMPFEFHKSSIPRLATILDLDPEFISDRLKKGEAYSRFAPVKIKRDIDFKILAALEEHRSDLPGVDYQIESKRFYTTKANASHILGYTKEIPEQQLKTLRDEYSPGDVIGSSGIESIYERALRGIKGAEFSTVNVRGQVIGSFENGKSDIPPVPGKDLQLSMDFSVQELAESLMTGKTGSVVAVDPENGGIIALVSKPDYDLNEFSGVVSPDFWKSLNQDPQIPLYNRATLTRYPPGSTFKMVLAAAALEKGLQNPDARIYCTGSYRLGNKVFKDLHVHGSTDMIEAIQRSCNVYFYQLMMKVGLDDWSAAGREFGFGQLTGVDISEESPGLLPSTAWMNKHYGEHGWTKGFLPSLGIGQGELGVTPLQMATYASILANAGTYYQPHAVEALIDKQTGKIDTLKFRSRRLPFHDRTWRIIREGMRRVVMEPGGTGGLARIKGVEVAGKTGTAQNPHGRDHAWFIGFAPFDHPKIAICVLVENAGYGGSFAAPIAGQCMEQYLYGRLIRFDKTPPTPFAQNGAPSTQQVALHASTGRGE